MRLLELNLSEPTKSFLRLCCPPNPFLSLPRLYQFWRDYRQYSRLAGRVVPYPDLWPQLNDRCATTPVGYYFFQDSWGFRKMLQNRPARHIDIGSTALLVSCMAAVVPTVSVDIRPLEVNMPGLTHLAGSITNLPFEDNSVESISSLCVIEHIGLGRYGDPLDPEGSVKAGRELSRVLKKGGNLYVSMPMGPASKVIFNAHRIFSKADALALFPTLSLVEYVLVGNTGTLGSLEAADRTDCPVGLFHFRK